MKRNAFLVVVLFLVSLSLVFVSATEDDGKTVVICPQDCEASLEVATRPYGSQLFGERIGSLLTLDDKAVREQNVNQSFRYGKDVITTELLRWQKDHNMNAAVLFSSYAGFWDVLRELQALGVPATVVHDFDNLPYPSDGVADSVYGPGVRHVLPTGDYVSYIGGKSAGNLAVVSNISTIIIVGPDVGWSFDTVRGPFATGVAEDCPTCVVRTVRFPLEAFTSNGTQQAVDRLRRLNVQGRAIAVGVFSAATQALLGAVDQLGADATMSIAFTGSIYCDEFVNPDSLNRSNAKTLEKGYAFRVYPDLYCDGKMAEDILSGTEKRIFQRAECIEVRGGNAGIPVIAVKTAEAAKRKLTYLEDSKEFTAGFDRELGRQRTNVEVPADATPSLVVGELQLTTPGRTPQATNIIVQSNFPNATQVRQIIPDSGTVPAFYSTTSNGLADVTIREPLTAENQLKLLQLAGGADIRIAYRSVSMSPFVVQGFIVSEGQIVSGTLTNDEVIFNGVVASYSMLNRTGHAVAMVNELLYVLGGNCSGRSSSECNADDPFLLLNTTTEDSSQLVGSVESLTPPLVAGRRMDHTVVVMEWFGTIDGVADSQWIVAVGGRRDVSYEPQMSVELYAVNRKRWVAPRFTGTLTRHPVNPCAFTIGSRIMVFGGATDSTGGSPHVMTVFDLQRLWVGEQELPASMITWAQDGKCAAAVVYRTSNLVRAVFSPNAVPGPLYAIELQQPTCGPLEELSAVGLDCQPCPARQLVSNGICVPCEQVLKPNAKDDPIQCYKYDARPITVGFAVIVFLQLAVIPMYGLWASLMRRSAARRAEESLALELSEAIANFDFPRMAALHDRAKEISPTPKLTSIQKALVLCGSNLRLFRRFIPLAVLQIVNVGEEQQPDAASLITGRRDSSFSERRLSTASSGMQIPVDGEYSEASVESVPKQGPQKADTLLKVLQPKLELREVSVLVTNIDDFHRMFVADNPVKLQAKQYSRLVDALNKYANASDGLLEGLQGDRCVISFNAAQPIKDHRYRACKVAHGLVSHTIVTSLNLVMRVGVATRNTPCGIVGGATVKRHSIGTAIVKEATGLCAQARKISGNVIVRYDRERDGDHLMETIEPGEEERDRKKVRDKEKNKLPILLLARGVFHELKQGIAGMDLGTDPRSFGIGSESQTGANQSQTNGMGTSTSHAQQTAAMEHYRVHEAIVAEVMDAHAQSSGQRAHIPKYNELIEKIFKGTMTTKEATALVSKLPHYFTVCFDSVIGNGKLFTINVKCF